MAAAVLALAAGAAQAESTDALYQKAKAEGTLVLWGAGPTAGYETAVRSHRAELSRSSKVRRSPAASAT